MSITASNSSGKLNLSMSNCHKLFSFCYRKVWKIIDIRKTFTQFLVTRSLKGLCAFYLSFYFILFFWKPSKRKEEGNRMQYFVSLFEKERQKGIYPFLWYYNFFFWFVGIFVYYLYIQIFNKWEKYFKNKTSSSWVSLTLQYTYMII